MYNEEASRKRIYANINVAYQHYFGVHLAVGGTFYL